MIPTLPARRTLLGAASIMAGAGVLAACRGDQAEPAAAGAEPARVRVNTGLGLFQGREAYLTVADELGFCRDERIEVEVLPGEGTEFNPDPARRRAGRHRHHRHQRRHDRAREGQVHRLAVRAWQSSSVSRRTGSRLVGG